MTSSPTRNWSEPKAVSHWSRIWSRGRPREKSVHVGSKVSKRYYNGTYVACGAVGRHRPTIIPVSRARANAARSQSDRVGLSVFEFQ